MQRNNIFSFFTLLCFILLQSTLSFHSYSSSLFSSSLINKYSNKLYSSTSISTESSSDNNNEFIPKTSTIQSFKDKKQKKKQKITDKERIEEISHDDIVQFIEKMPSEAREFFQKHFLPANPPPPPLYRADFILEEEGKRLWKESEPLLSIGADGLFDSHIHFAEEYARSIIKSFDKDPYKNLTFTRENQSDLFSLVKKKRDKKNPEPKNGLIFIKLTSLKLLPLEIASNFFKNPYIDENFLLLEVRPRGILIGRKEAFLPRINYINTIFKNKNEDEKEENEYLNVLSTSDLLLSLRIQPKQKQPVPPSQYGRALSKKRGRGKRNG